MNASMPPTDLPMVPAMAHYERRVLGESSEVVMDGATIEPYVKAIMPDAWHQLYPWLFGQAEQDHVVLLATNYTLTYRIAETLEHQGNEWLVLELVSCGEAHPGRPPEYAGELQEREPDDADRW